MENAIIAVSKCLKDDIWGSNKPNQLLSDNGAEFTGKKFEDYLKSMNLKHLKGQPYKPSTQGMVERLNRTLLHQIKTLSMKNPSITSSGL